MKEFHLVKPVQQKKDTDNLGSVELSQVLPTFCASKSVLLIYECYMCKFHPTSYNDLKRHLRKHTNARDRKCKICNEILTVRELNEHLCYSEKGFECEYCNLTFSGTIHLLQHLDNEHQCNKTFHRCSKCPRYFGMARLRELHERNHEEKVMNVPSSPFFLCEVCSKGFKTENKLKEHLIAHSDQSK